MVISIGFICFCLFSAGGYYFFVEGLKRKYPERFEKIRQLACDPSYYEIVFIGSSRTLYGIDTKEIQKTTGKKVFNAGLEGATANEMLFALKTFLSSHPAPKHVYVMLDLHTFKAKSSDPINLHYYTSLLNCGNISDNLEPLVGTKIVLWKKVPFLSLIDFSEQMRAEAIHGWLHPSSAQHSYDGYIPLIRHFSKSTNHENFSSDTISIRDRSSFQEFQKITQQKGIAVHYFEGAYLSTWAEIHKPSRIYDKLSTTLPINSPLKQYTGFADTLFFKDETHLNAIGAKKYAEILAFYINHEL